MRITRNINGQVVYITLTDDELYALDDFNVDYDIKDDTRTTG